MIRKLRGAILEIFLCLVSLVGFAYSLSTLFDRELDLRLIRMAKIDGVYKLTATREVRNESVRVTIHTIAFAMGVLTILTKRAYPEPDRRKGGEWLTLGTLAIELLVVLKSAMNNMYWSRLRAYLDAGVKPNTKTNLPPQ